LNNRERDTIENTSYRHTRIYVLLSLHNFFFLVRHNINKYVADYSLYDTSYFTKLIKFFDWKQQMIIVDVLMFTAKTYH